jgi:hypothetical protein
MHAWHAWRKRHHYDSNQTQYIYMYIYISYDPLYQPPLDQFLYLMKDSIEIRSIYIHPLLVFVKVEPSDKQLEPKTLYNKEFNGTTFLAGIPPVKVYRQHPPQQELEKLSLQPPAPSPAEASQTNPFQIYVFATALCQLGCPCCGRGSNSNFSWGSGGGDTGGCMGWSF